ATVRWHAWDLTESRYLISEGVGIFPAGLIDPGDVSLFGALATTRRAAVLAAAFDVPGISFQDVAPRVGLTRQSVSKVASELAEFGLVRLVDDGRFRRLYATDLLARKREANRDRAVALEGALLRAATREELSAVKGVTSADVDTLLGLLSDGSGRDASGQLFLCPKCGSFAGTAAESCPFCGVEFEASTDSKLSDQIEDFVVEEDAPARICLSCGAGMGREATKCGMCGRQYTSEEVALLPGFQPSLDESSPFCPRCGGYLFSDETECAICGTAVASAKPAPPTADATGVVKG